MEWIDSVMGGLALTTVGAITIGRLCYLAVRNNKERKKQARTLDELSVRYINGRPYDMKEPQMVEDYQALMKISRAGLLNGKSQETIESTMQNIEIALQPTYRREILESTSRQKMCIARKTSICDLSETFRKTIGLYVNAYDIE